MRIQPSYSQGFARSVGESIHPHLWHRLQAAYVPAFGQTGIIVHDLLHRNNLVDAGSTSANTWINTPFGSAVNFDSSAKEFSKEPATFNLTGQMTVYLLCRIGNFSQSTAALIGHGSNTTTGNRFYVAYNNGFGGDQIRFIWGGANINTTTTFGNVAFHHIVGVRSGVTGNWDVTLYVDTVVEASVVGSATNPGAAGASNFYINELPSGAGNSAMGDFVVCYLWDRAISINEIRQLYVNVFAPFEQSRRLGFVAAAPGGTDGAAMYHHLQNLGVY